MSTRLEEYENAPQIEGHIIFERKWYLLLLPKDFHQQMIGEVEKLGISFTPMDKPHVSIVKKEAPSQNKADWGVAFINEKTTIKYSPIIHYENGCHFWIDCYSPRLCEIREHFAVPTLKRDDGIYLVNFHMTIARRNEPIPATRRPLIRISPPTHIDVETGMQHL